MLSLTEREVIVKLHFKGKTQQEIADLIGCTQSAVHRWIKRHGSKEGLRTRPRSGRPTKLKGKNIDLVRNRILEQINATNQDFGCVSTKEIKELIAKEIGVTYSTRHVERLMHKMGFSLITPRPQHVRHDQAKVDSFRDEFKKNLSKSMWTMK